MSETSSASANCLFFFKKKKKISQGWCYCWWSWDCHLYVWLGTGVRRKPCLPSSSSSSLNTILFRVRLWILTVWSTHSLPLCAFAFLLMLFILCLCFSLGHPCLCLPHLCGLARHPCHMGAVSGHMSRPCRPRALWDTPYKKGPCTRAFLLRRWNSGHSVTAAVKLKMPSHCWPVLCKRTLSGQTVFVRWLSCEDAVRAP